MTERERANLGVRVVAGGATAANEVLREIHNAVRAALKDFSSQGVFLYGPQAEVWPGRVGEWWARL